MKELENASARLYFKIGSIKLQLQQQLKYCMETKWMDLINYSDIYSEDYYHTAFEIQRVSILVGIYMI